MKRAAFTGMCRPCWAASYKHRTVCRGPETRINKTGYVVVNRVPRADQHLFDAMRGNGSFIMEHRLVMARALGRALRSNECVDHMNGVKSDNRLDNLRIYVSGKQQPGSCPGYGTFYDEWQRAEARVAELERFLVATALHA